MVRPPWEKTPKDELFLLQTLFLCSEKGEIPPKTAELMPFLSIFTLKY